MDRCPLFPITGSYGTVCHFAILGASGIIFLSRLGTEYGLRPCLLYALLYSLYLIQNIVHSRYLIHLLNKRTQGVKRLEPLSRNSGHSRPSCHPFRSGIILWLCKGFLKKGWSFSFGRSQRCDSFGQESYSTFCDFTVKLLCPKKLWGLVIIRSIHLWNPLA